MSVITADVVIEKMNREDVLAWLSKPENHGLMLEGVFAGFQADGPGNYLITLKTQVKKRPVRYRFARVDAEHGGRRVLVELEGRRVGGTLHYSLRTMKPSTDTLVTLHVDYDTEGLLGTILDHAGIRRPYEEAWNKVLANLKRLVEATRAAD